MGNKLMEKPAYASTLQNQIPPESNLRWCVMDGGGDVTSWQLPKPYLLSAQVPWQRACLGKITMGKRRW